MLSLSTAILLGLHVTAGGLSLVLFWIPLFTRKGHLWHRRIGRAYVYAMSTVVVTAAILSGLAMAANEHEKGWALLFLSVLTTVPLAGGIQILKTQRLTPGYRHLRLGLAAALLAVSFGVLGAAYVLGSGVLYGFGALGLVGGASDLRQFRPAVTEGKPWLREHYEGMLFSGAAAYTAFLVFGGSTILPAVFSGWMTLVPWLLPTVSVVAALPFIHRRHTNESKAPGTHRA